MALQSLLRLSCTPSAFPIRIPCVAGDQKSCYSTCQNRVRGDTLQRYDSTLTSYRHNIDNPVDDIDLFLYPTSGGGTPFQLI